MSLFEQFPYTNYHDLNLDWIIQEIKKCYSPDNPPEAVVLSVNGEDGNVILYKDAIVRFPDTEAGTWNIFRKADEQDNGIQFRKNQPAQRIQDAHRYDMYDAGNPPPYPVTSVDGHTGAVATWANTGNVDVVLPHESETDKWALLRDNPSGPLGIQFEVDEDSDEPTGYFILKPEGEEIQKIKILTASDIPSEAGVITVNGSSGIVILYAGDIKMAANDNTTIKAAIEGAENMTVSDYSTVTEYSVGDFCRYLGVMYVCTGSTSGAFNPAKWSTTSASAEIKSIKSHQATDESNISTLQIQMTTANTRIGQNEAIVAYPENGSTASTNYTVGQYIARNGYLYKVIANISAGDQFTGSNISAVDNLGHEVSALNNIMAGLITLRTISVTKSVDVASGATETVEFTAPTVAGYTPLLFFYDGTPTSGFVATNNITNYWYSTSRNVTVRNVSASTINASVTFTGLALYIKSVAFAGIL